MSRLELTFFGSPRISLDGAPLFNRLDKTLALVALLALHSPSMSRELLITLLWSGSSLSKAQSALRTTLWRLKDAGLSPWLEIQRDTIALKPDENTWIDVAEFQVNLVKARQPPHDQASSCPECSPWLESAAGLYHGDFMAGYTPRNASGFDEWRVQFSQSLRDEVSLALKRLTRGYHQQGLYSLAVQAARRWLAVDPYNEETHQLIMRSYAYNNQRADAITHYRAFKHQVEKKLGVPPAKEITALYHLLLRGKTPPAVPSAPLKEAAFLMLDIYHYADLWARHGVMLEAVLERLSTVVQGGLLNSGGRMLKQTGDGFLLFFDHGQPLLSAVALHRLIAQTSWGLPEPLSIRMAITTVSNHRSSYPEYSPELVSCRSLLYAASEHQILLTEQAARVLELPISSRVNPLGSYLLPGQANPMQVYELVHPHLPQSEARGLRSLVRSPANLPIQSTRFVGRDGELEQLYHLLAQPERRLLTLVGPGGVGKTRLAIQLISQLQNTQWDGLGYVPLAGHVNPKTIYRPIAEALNLPLNQPEDPETQLIRYLHSRRMVLLLDNFEHLLEAAPLIVQMLEGAPGLRIIITSRQRLNLYLETPFEVQGLPFPENPDVSEFNQYSGVKLFIQNAQRVFPAFVLRPEDKASIIQICRHVDGLPLGIELASTWVRALTCQEIAAELQQKTELPQSTSQDVPLRHRSLRAAFEHSWSLLSEEDRRILARLSVFNNGFFPPAAEHIANASPAMLASYIDKSMLARQPNGRYLMLDVIRVYALEQIQANPVEYEQLLDRFSHYYLHHLSDKYPTFYGQDAAAQIRNIWLDASNIRLALNWAMDHHHWALFSQSIDPLMSVFELQGRFREGYDNASLLLKHITSLVGLQQPKIYYALLGWEGSFSFRLGFSEEAIDKLRARLEYAQRQGDLLQTAHTLLVLADAHQRHGEFNTALAEANQSLSILEPLAASAEPLISVFYANALCVLGSILIRLAEFDPARQAVDRAAEILQQSDAVYIKIRLLNLQAMIANADRRYAVGLNLRLEALAIADEFNDRRSIAGLMCNLAESAEYLGDLQGAYDYMVKATQLSDENGERQLGALYYNNLAYCALMINRDAEAVVSYHKSLHLYREIGNKIGYFLTLRDISRAYLKMGNLAAAHAHLREALQRGIELADPLKVLQLLPAIARLLINQGNPEQAAPLCTCALNHPKSPDNLRKAAGELLAKLGVAIDQPTGQDLTAQDLPLPTFQSLLNLLERD